MTTIGFTGTRNGMTPEQRAAVVNLMESHKPKTVVHGACVGADTDFVEIARKYQCVVVARPGHGRNGDTAFQSARAIELSDVVHEPQQFPARNRAIVKEATMIIACPPSKPLLDRGGTVMTINFARKAKKSISIVYPDGSLEISATPWTVEDMLRMELKVKFEP